jgi:hypothetical protein
MLSIKTDTITDDQGVQTDQTDQIEPEKVPMPIESEYSSIESKLAKLTEMAAKRKPVTVVILDDESDNETPTNIDDVNRNRLIEQQNEYAKFSKLHRDLLIQGTRHQINTHDFAKQQTDFKYISYNQTLSNEVAKQDINETVDEELDTILSKKLNIYEEPADFVKTDAMIKKMEDEKLANQQRTNDHKSRLELVREAIANDDLIKKRNNPLHISFAEHCDYNELETSEDAEHMNKRFKGESASKVEELYLSGETPTTELLHPKT